MKLLFTLFIFSNVFLIDSLYAKDNSSSTQQRTYSASEITKKDDLLFSYFIKRAVPYAKHPDIKDGFYFDLSSMKLLINTPGFVKVLEDFVESTNYYPPKDEDFGVNPYRKSDHNWKFWVKKAQWKERIAKSYVNTLQKITQSTNRVLNLRIYKSRQYTHALSVGIHRVLTKKDIPQKALDEVARRWDKIMNSVGRNKQQEAYSYIVEVEKKILI